MDDEALLALLLESVATGIPVARVVVATGEGTGRWALARRDDAPGWERLEATSELLDRARGALKARRSETVALGARTYWIEVLGSQPTLLVVGAGHLAQPLVTIGALCDFKCVVLDDRPSFADATRFPEAAAVIAAPITAALRDFPLDADSYVVLVTRGHAHDVEALLEIVERPHAYIGMVGSKRRVQGVWTLLDEQGRVDRARLERVHAPIGLDIGAESPGEIAVAIMAEITLVRRGGTALPLSEAIRQRGARVHQGRIGKGRRSTE